jgi:hypothetical protein
MARAPMSNTELGIAYERYVGHLYELGGWCVIYRGILKGKRDQGRDLVCAKEQVIHVVQCKCWSSHSEVPLEVVTKLLETTQKYRQRCHDAAQALLDLGGIQNATVKSVLVTSTVLSSLARAKAKAERVSYREKKSLLPYPEIKCVKSEGLYYVPTQAQFDSVPIRLKQGDGRVSTEEEAMRLGYAKANSPEFQMPVLSDSSVRLAETSELRLCKGTTAVSYPPLGARQMRPAEQALESGGSEENCGDTVISLNEIDSDLADLARLMRIR